MSSGCRRACNTDSRSAVTVFPGLAGCRRPFGSADCRIYCSRNYMLLTHNVRMSARIGLLAIAIALSAALAVRSEPLSLDAGAIGAWQKIRKLQTTASVMHTTAHPDDEHGGMLARLSRGQGARVALLMLTRGESGDNAIGPELFDGLGLIRTQEVGGRRPVLRSGPPVLHLGRRLRVFEAPG